MATSTLITVAPGVFIDPLIRRDIDPAEQYILLDATGLRRLGLTGAQEKLLLRLEYAGLIKTHKITPRRRLLNLSSWQRHLEAVDADPDYWDHPERRRRWRLACLAV
jgi:hypothetical protein